MSALQLAGLALVSQVWAPLLVANFPTLQSLTVTQVRVKGPTGALYGRFVDVKDQPERQLLVRGTSSRGKWLIGIDLDAQVVGYADWGILTSRYDGNSADLAVMVLGLPGLLASLPLQLPWWAFKSLARALSGLTLHQQVLCAKLRPKLPERYQAPFLQALRNENNGVAAAHWEKLRRARREKEGDGEADAG